MQEALTAPTRKSCTEDVSKRRGKDTLPFVVGRRCTVMSGPGMACWCIFADSFARPFCSIRLDVASCGYEVMASLAC